MPLEMPKQALMTEDRGRLVLVTDATGLVGCKIVPPLLTDRTVDQVHRLVRQPLPLKHLS